MLKFQLSYDLAFNYITIMPVSMHFLMAWNLWIYFVFFSPLIILKPLITCWIKSQVQQDYIVMTVPKVMPSILWCWPMTSEADVGGMAVEVEPSHQYSIAFCCQMRDVSRGAVWQNGVWHGSADRPRVCHWIPPCGKNGTHWYSLMLCW